MASPDQAAILKILSSSPTANVLIGGIAGSGKSAVLIEWKRTVPENDIGEIILLQADSTRVFWSFCGLSTVLDDAVEEPLIAKLKRDEQRIEKVKSLKHLIIDNVNLMSAALFDSLSSALSEIRQDPRDFGGVRLIIAGDFLGLLPPTHAVFQAQVWKKLKLAAFYLEKSFRFQQPELTAFVQNVGLGVVRDEEAAFAESRRVPRIIAERDKFKKTTILVSTDEEAHTLNSHIVAQNFKAQKVTVEHYAKLDFQGEPDEQTKKSLTAKTRFLESVNFKKVRVQFLAPFPQAKLYNRTKKETRIVDIPVGKIGTIVDYAQRDFALGAVDRMSLLGGFGDLQRVVTVEFEQDFRVFLGLNLEEAEHGETKLSKTQIPLIVAYSLSFSRTVGLTLPGVHVGLSAEDLRRPGAFYTAISRATSSGTLTFDHTLPHLSHLSLGPSEEVRRFYDATFGNRFPWSKENGKPRILGIKRPLETL